MVEKNRLDMLMVERGLAESRSLAQRLVMAGQVRVDGQVVIKPAQKVVETAEITIDQGPRYVSRGGEKLEGALIAFNMLDLTGKICVDVGASTGGFTDCLLQHGALKVYAIDVGYGILHWKIRQDPRVISMERTNARFVNGFEDAIDLITVDASFISLRTLLPVMQKWLKEGQGELVMLIKPQFEAGRKDAAKGEGVIRDPMVHRKVITEVLAFAQESGLSIQGLVRSPLYGPKGNTEFLVHLVNKKDQAVDITALVDSVIEPNEFDEAG